MQSLQVSPTLLNTAARIRLFGRFAFKMAPDDVSRIILTDSWAKDNLVSQRLMPRLAVLDGGDWVTMHRLVLPRFLELVNEWEAHGVLEDVVQWGGSYVPRLVRGSATTLSAHAWGSAFDVNVRANPLGHAPAAIGQPGTVLRLVPIAERLGWGWGGRMSRCDGMHFEVAKL